MMDLSVGLCDGYAECFEVGPPGEIAPKLCDPTVEGSHGGSVPQHFDTLHFRLNALSVAVAARS